MEISLTRREFFHNTALPLGVLSVVGMRAGASPDSGPRAKQPNILFVMTDQQRFEHFVQDLTAISKRHGVAIMTIGGVFILENAEATKDITNLGILR